MARIDDMRAFSDHDLLEELENSYREIFNLRFRAVTRQLSNVHEVRNARRKIAQIKTVVRQRELAQMDREA